MLTLVILVCIAIALSSRLVRRALPFESLLAFGLAGVTMMAILLTGHIG